MKCPGQDTRYWGPQDIFEADCPKCQKTVEFFKDDSARKCRNCGSKVLNPRLDFGCAAYCAYADQCLKELPSEILAERKDLLKDRVALEMRRYFDTDTCRIDHALKVVEYAQRILKGEQGDIAIVLIAAYLHDIGIKDAEATYRSSAAKYQEELGPPVARGMLEKLGADEKLVDEVCDIIGHHHSPGPEETDNFKILYDADMLVNLADRSREEDADPEKRKRLIDTCFFTETGKKIAAENLVR